MPTSLDRLTLLMLETGRLIKRRLHVQDGAHGPLSGLQMAALVAVDEARAPLMKDVASYLCVAPPTATPIVEGLVASGHLKRARDRRDRRAMRLSLTPKGRHALAAGRKAYAGRMRGVLSALSPEDRKDLARVLAVLAKQFRA